MYIDAYCTKIMRSKKYLSYGIIWLIISLYFSDTAFCQFLTNEQISFLKTHAKAILPDSSQTQPNWSYLLPHLKGKKIILIGEPNHGSKEIFALRNSLIKYLHTETGARTILFESGIGELINADINRAGMSASEMTKGLFGPWRTKEFVELMTYVKAQNIAIAGFDVQRTGESFRFILKEISQKYSIDSLSTYDLEARYSLATRELTNRAAIYDSLKTKTAKLIGDYQKVKEELVGHIAKKVHKDLLFANITIENRIRYLSFMLQFLKDKDWNRRWAARDSAMANNAEWLMKNIYQDQPIIIIGHNFHLGKYNENETTMGEILAPHYRNKMYTIGIFAGSGSYSDNFGKEVKMMPQDSSALDIKHIIASLSGSISFLNIPDKFSNGSNWLNQDIIVNDTFIDLKNSNKMVLSKVFDGLVFIKRVSPTILNYK